MKKAILNIVEGYYGNGMKWRKAGIQLGGRGECEDDGSEEDVRRAYSRMGSRPGEKKCGLWYQRMCEG